MELYMQLKRNVYFVSFTWWTETPSIIRLITKHPLKKTDKSLLFLQINPLDLRGYQQIFLNNIKTTKYMKS